MASIITTSSNPNNLGSISDQALMLTNFDCINRKMTLPTAMLELRIGMFISMCDLTGKAINPAREDVLNPSQIINGFFFGIKDNSIIIPTASTTPFIGISSIFSLGETYSCHNVKSAAFAAGSSPYATDAMSRIYTGLSGTTNRVYGGFNTQTPTAINNIGILNQSDSSLGALNFVSNTDATKMGVTFCGLRYTFSATQQVTLQLLLFKPPASDPTYLTGITDLSDDSLKTYLNLAPTVGNQLSLGGVAGTNYQEFAPNFYFRHPFQTFNIRVHNYGFLAMDY